MSSLSVENLLVSGTQSTGLGEVQSTHRIQCLACPWWIIR